MRTCSTPKNPEATPVPTLPPSVLDQLRQWRLRASLRFVGKSLRSSHPPCKAGR
jgi:hypothetical protein